MTNELREKIATLDIDGHQLQNYLSNSHIDKLEYLINQEVRKALDSIEVPEKHKETWYNKNLITHEQKVRETGIRRHNQAIDKYIANIKEVRKQYE